MYFSRTLIASAVLACAAATTHLGEAAASQTIAASETVSTGIATLSDVLTAPTAAAGMVNTHVIQVGGSNGSLIFSPSNVQAEIGDLIQFQFNAKNHSVVQSTFDQPCRPIQDVMPNKTDAFYSGFMPTNKTITDTRNVLTYTIRVMNKNPIWYYCSQGKHCQAGMVGAINAATTGNKTVAAFAAIAKVQTENLSPGQAPGSAAAGGGAASSGAGGAAATGADSAATATSGQATGSVTVTPPAQATVNAAPGRFGDVSKQSLLGLGLSGLVALLAL